MPSHKTIHWLNNCLIKFIKVSISRGRKFIICQYVLMPYNAIMDITQLINKNIINCSDFTRIAVFNFYHSAKLFFNLLPWSDGIRNTTTSILLIFKSILITITYNSPDFYQRAHTSSAAWIFGTFLVNIHCHAFKVIIPLILDPAVYITWQWILTETALYIHIHYHIILKLTGRSHVDQFNIFTMFVPPTVVSENYHTYMDHTSKLKNHCFTITCYKSYIVWIHLPTSNP